MDACKSTGENGDITPYCVVGDSSGYVVIVIKLPLGALSPCELALAQ